MSIHDEAEAVLRAAQVQAESAELEAGIERMVQRLGCCMARAVLAQSHGQDWQLASVTEYRLDAARRLYVAVLAWRCTIHGIVESETRVLLRPDASPVFIELTQTAHSTRHVP